MKLFAATTTLTALWATTTTLLLSTAAPSAVVAESSSNAKVLEDLVEGFDDEGLAGEFLEEILVTAQALEETGDSEMVAATLLDMKEDTAVGILAVMDDQKKFVPEVFEWMQMIDDHDHEKEETVSTHNCNC